MISDQGLGGKLGSLGKKLPPCPPPPPPVDRTLAVRSVLQFAERTQLPAGAYLLCLHVLWFVYSLTWFHIIFGIPVIYMTCTTVVHDMTTPTHDHSHIWNSSLPHGPVVHSDSHISVLSLFLQECGQSRGQPERAHLHWRTTPSQKLTTTEQWCLEDPLGAIG